MRTSARVRWWFGWHPWYAVGAGAMAGLLVGNVVVTWTVRAAMLGEGVGSAAAPLKAVVGDGGAFLFALAAVPAVLSVAVGAVLGVGLWLVGVWTVNGRAEAVLDRARGDGYVVSDGRGALPLVVPARTYHVTTVDLDGEEVSVTERRLSMPDRGVETARSLCLPADGLRVAYDEETGRLRFEADGDEHAVGASDRPDDLLAAL